jgi:hypothetical protein
MDSNPHEELDWLAFQYVANEMSATERSAFEERLDLDQAAREAVAQAMELSLAVEVAYREDAVVVAARDRLLGQGSRGWWSVGVAACVLFALVALSQLTRNAGERLAISPTPGDQLAIAWSETRVALPTSANLSAADENLLEDDLLALRGEDDDLLALPTWLVAAVSDAAAETGQEFPAPSDVENRTVIE